MGIIVDVIIIAIIALSTFLAYKRGLIDVAVGICAFIISIVATFILYQPISNLIINVTSIDESIQNAIYEKANDMIENKEEGNNEVTNEILESAKNNMLPETARNISINIVRGGVIIILFVGIRIALRFVKAITDLIAKLPIIEQVDKLGGAIFGFLRGLLFVFVILLVLMIPNSIDPSNSVNESINNSYVGKTMYENNILKVLFVKTK